MNGLLLTSGRACTLTEVTKQTKFPSSVSSSAWVLVSLTLADALLEAESLDGIMSRIDEITRVNR
jgi:hypothetical protein